ncbi:MAG: cobalamin-dependent protein [bacterium]|nr:cobalamin-dependent protein [bacterium]
MHPQKRKNLIQPVPKNKILLFKNISGLSGARGEGWSLASLYLSSALKKAGYRVIISTSRISLEKNGFITDPDGLKKILKENPDINFIGITLWEAYFEKARALIRFLREATRAFIGVGGIMPTLTPRHVLTHLPDINFLVRGSGEVIFPRLVRALDRMNIDSPLSEKVRKDLSGLKGLIFRNRDVLLSLDDHHINRLRDTPDLIDPSFLKKEDLNDGLFLYTSSGCANSCSFCSSPDRGKFHALSSASLFSLIKRYSLYLKKIYKGRVPSPAYRLAFYDDDFLTDPKRAIRFFRSLKKTPFRINFFQTGINAFYQRPGISSADRLHQTLFRTLSRDLFDQNKETGIYIGLENLSGEELKRLNKGYDLSRAEKVISALAAKGINTAYHFIACNQMSTPDDLFENLLEFSVLQVLYRKQFRVLTPIVPYLVSFYPTVSYKRILREKKEKFLKVRKMLSVKGRPEYDYPLMDHDIPVNANVRRLIPFLSRLFLTERSYHRILDKSLLELLIMKEKDSPDPGLDRVIERYRDYPEIIFQRTGYRIPNDRNNLQLMITRRCQLRCRYCPIIKKDADMDVKSLYRAIDLLFTSARKELRLDFTGGEPLLRFDLVKKGVEYARFKAHKHDRKISFYMVSNLIALNDRIADFLSKEDFFLEISLDGREQCHNTYKTGKEKNINPYRLTTASLAKILRRKIRHCGVMVTAPSNVEQMVRNFSHLLQLGIREVSINYAMAWHWSRKKTGEFLSQLEYIRRKFSGLLKKGAVRLSNLESRTEPAILNNEIMVDTDGMVYLLTDWLFEKRTGKKVRPLGDVTAFQDLNQVPTGEFHALYRMLKIYQDPDIRKIIFNNLEIGNSVKDHFK